MPERDFPDSTPPVRERLPALGRRNDRAQSEPSARKGRPGARSSSVPRPRHREVTAVRPLSPYKGGSVPSSHSFRFGSGSRDLDVTSRESWSFLRVTQVLQRESYVPSLTPKELQEARKRSGNLGGRPRKPTRDEAREAALDELLPRSLHVLRAHLGAGDDINPQAWRAALRVFEHAFGKPPDEIDEPKQPQTPGEVELMTLDEIRALRARLGG